MQGTLSIEDKTTEEVDNFCYLSGYITNDGGANVDVTNRIQKARQAFISLNNILTRTQLSRDMKIRFSQN